MSTQNEPLNTAPIQQFISQVKSADASQVKEVKLNIQQAKRLNICVLNKTRNAYE